MRLIADTTVLIHLWRLRKEPQRLADLRKKLIEPGLPWQVLFEFARGAYFRGVTDIALGHFLEAFTPIAITESQVMRAARLDADLNLRGMSIGSSDIWIAAAALETNLPVLTANVEHFCRVPGVQIIAYSITS